MKINKEEIPVIMSGSGTVLRSQKHLGKMTASYNEMTAGTDFGPHLRGLKKDHCHCSHYGAVLEGTLLITYDNGEEELIKDGDIFYIPPGHSAKVERDLKIIVFSTTKEHTEVLNHVVKSIGELNNMTKI
ncbi:cupin domain-containing protein [Carboxylicivirga sp. RSCT41]|uniref:cupin domain-containing protein n=1 Tax=Carboxylicivirga agarovorans TaxID=3417570 RepID=UPI003D325DA3